MFKEGLHKLFKPALTLVAAATFLVSTPAAAAGGTYEDVLRSCASQMNSLPVHVAMPLGRQAGVVYPKSPSAGSGEACTDFTWVKVFGQVSVAQIERAGKLPVNEWDCQHSINAWALYKKTSGGATFIHGGASGGSWKNDKCVYDGTGPAAAAWGDQAAGTATGTLQEYRIAFFSWQHDDANIGHTADYCSDLHECAMPVKLFFAGPFKGPKADYAFYNPGSGEWAIKDSTTNNESSKIWGLSQDIPIAGDFDGDFKSDYAVWRPSNGTWYVIRSTNGTAFEQQWGLVSDIPVAADYDGDGKTDIAVYRPSESAWYVIRSSNWTSFKQVWGGANVRPVPALYDDDVKADFAVWNKTTGLWTILNSMSNTTRHAQWGIPGDIPVPGAYTSSDWHAQPAVWRPSNGTWHIGHPNGTWFAQWGMNGDVPLLTDFDGDGELDYTVWRPKEGRWYHNFSSNRAQTFTVWGKSGAVPVGPFYSTLN